MSFTWVRGINYLEAYFVPCELYDGGFFDQLLVGGFYLGLFSYVSVVALAMYYRNWTNALGVMGLFVTDFVVEIMAFIMPRPCCGACCS
jgi:hypothetical protein